MNSGDSKACRIIAALRAVPRGEGSGEKVFEKAGGTENMEGCKFNEVMRRIECSGSRPFIILSSSSPIRSLLIFDTIAAYCKS